MTKVISIPSSWTTASLGEIANSVGGGTPSKTDATFWTDGSVPWVSPKDMKTFVIRSTGDRLTQAAAMRLSLVPRESVLIVVRSGILSRVLPVAINDAPVTLNQDMRAFVPSSGIAARFLAWQLVALDRDIRERCAKDGTTVASIESHALNEYPISIAPADEQRRIVDRLEELLSDLDAGVAELKAAQKKLARYRQSLLRAAINGVLTEDWRTKETRNCETGVDLIIRITESHGVSKKAKDDLPKSPVSMVFPVTWGITTIDELAKVGTGVTPLRSNPLFFTGGTIPWITSGAVNDEIVRNAREFVTEVALRQCRLRLYPAGTLLIAMYGEGKTRGKTSELAIAATINQALAALVFEGEAAHCRSFVKLVLLNSYERLREKASGGVQPNLNLDIVKSIEVPLPPLDEQAEIVSRFELQVEEIRRQQSAIERRLKQAAAQRQNILKAAFSGQLVPQDPTDEPASALLDRIRAERAGLPAESTKRPRKAKAPA